MTPELGRQLWTELHEYAWAYPDEPTAMDAQQARDWLATWTANLPQQGCHCASKWPIIRQQHPVRLESRAAFYWWTVLVHDCVNAHLGKPLAAPDWHAAHLP